ncbi:unnamed protein product [Cunninghamella blakesleeana]
MYDPNLKYIAISYRWGELNEQQVETPDYTAHITSFELDDLMNLCLYVKKETDLKEIDYLWIDTISINQQNEKKRIETILKMDQIYQNATYILAIPDLHLHYLRKNPANNKVIKLIEKCSHTIYFEIFNATNARASSTRSKQYTYTDDQFLFMQKLKKMTNGVRGLKIENQALNKKIEEIQIEIEEIKLKQEEDELKKAYQFLAYLIDDWSNRAWVISECRIAKQKYEDLKTPLKYWFLSLSYSEHPFFSYCFDDIDDQQYSTNNENDDNKNNRGLEHQNVDDFKTFNQFLKSRFIQRSHLEMILNSKATKNKDRFNAILPSWNEYKHMTKYVSKWSITGMSSVILKLYEIIDKGDLWEKAKLLLACSLYSGDDDIVILPSFANNFNIDRLRIVEKCNYDNVAYIEFEEEVLEYIGDEIEDEELTQIAHHMEISKRHSIPIWTENLTSIQFNKHYCYLSVKSKSFFIRNENYNDFHRRENFQSKLLFDDYDDFHYVLIPFFTFTLPKYVDNPLIYYYGSNICLVGNREKNKWISISDNQLSSGHTEIFDSEDFCYDDDYTFNIY